MDLFSIEHSPTAYRVDFALYGTAVLALAAALVWIGPHEQVLVLAAWVGAGLIGWSLLEYLLHRFVLHGLRPFSRWHAQHHARPTALICAPTALSATLIATLVFLPALLWGDTRSACALTLGLLIGYLGYAVTHHAIHHWRGTSGWLQRRQRWHAMHHQPLAPAGSPSGPPGADCFGVTSQIWDRLLGTGRHPRQRRAA
jgi:sterol desaturase/sphingolipid hydroxylase (fatty acid hydroxylase superfamily)